jgi:hypothetical protein
MCTAHILRRTQAPSNDVKGRRGVRYGEKLEGILMSHLMVLNYSEGVATTEEQKDREVCLKISMVVRAGKNINKKEGYGN